LTVRASWLESREETRLQTAARLPLAGAAWLYGAAARAHRGLHRAGTLRTARLSCQVVSVGSLLVGGTGKTPTAAWIAAELHRRGRKPALVSRGYRRRSSERVLVVSDGRFIHSRAEAAGDEPMLLAAHAPGVPVLVGSDRALVGLRALSVFGAEIVVLDDGFQHHPLHRDLDLLTFDGALGLGNRRVLPRGPLREPIGALRLADAVGVVDGPLDAADAALLERMAPGAYRFNAIRRAKALRPLSGGPGASPEALDGAEVGMLAALARPESLRRTLSALGARVVAERTFRDHHRYRARDLRGLAREAPLWVTTEKDAIKITPAWTGSADLRVLSIALEIEGPRRFADWIESRLS
jgi:tetraacyldisaccharide 4'-kinase